MHARLSPSFSTLPRMHLGHFGSLATTPRSLKYEPGARSTGRSASLCGILLLLDSATAERFAPPTIARATRRTPRAESHTQVGVPEDSSPGPVPAAAGAVGTEAELAVSFACRASSPSSASRAKALDLPHLKGLAVLCGPKVGYALVPDLHVAGDDGEGG